MPASSKSSIYCVRPDRRHRPAAHRFTREPARRHEVSSAASTPPSRPPSPPAPRRAYDRRRLRRLRDRTHRQLRCGAGRRRDRVRVRATGAQATAHLRRVGSRRRAPRACVKAMADGAETADTSDDGRAQTAAKRGGCGTWASMKSAPAQSSIVASRARERLVCSPERPDRPMFANCAGVCARSGVGIARVSESAPINRQPGGEACTQLPTSARRL